MRDAYWSMASSQIKMIYMPHECFVFAAFLLQNAPGFVRAERGMAELSAGCELLRARHVVQKRAEPYGVRIAAGLLRGDPFGILQHAERMGEVVAAGGVAEFAAHPLEYTVPEAGGCLGRVHVRSRRGLRFRRIRGRLRFGFRFGVQLGEVG